MNQTADLQAASSAIMAAREIIWCKIPDFSGRTIITTTECVDLLLDAANKLEVLAKEVSNEDN